MNEEYFCPNCNAVLNEQDGFDPELGAWTCTECGETLYGDDVETTMNRFEGIVWYCDECNAVLNIQDGFSDIFSTWCCTKCGHENHITEDEIYESESDYEDSNKHRCPVCGDILEDQYSYSEYEDVYTCTDCDTELFHKDDEYEVLYRCPNCDEILNEQIGFDDAYYAWDCAECGASLEKENDEYHIVEDGGDYEGESSEGSLETCISRKEARRRVREAEKERRKEIRKEKRRKRLAFCKRHWRGLLMLIAILCVGCFGGYRFYQYQRSVPVGVSSEDLIGQNYEDVTSALKKAGFTSVTTKSIYDIGVDEINIEGTVESVSIDGDSSFSADKRYPFDAKVIVSYHMIENVHTPLSAKEAKKLQYEDLEKQLRDAGFVNITLEPDYDLIIGWVKKEGRVESVSINGNSSFETYSSYRPDAEIIIEYHALRKDKDD